MYVRPVCELLIKVAWSYLHHECRKADSPVTLLLSRTVIVLWLKLTTGCYVVKTKKISRQKTHTQHDHRVSYDTCT